MSPHNTRSTLRFFPQQQAWQALAQRLLDYLSQTAWQIIHTPVTQMVPGAVSSCKREDCL